MKAKKVQLVSASGQSIGNYMIQDSSDLRNLFGGYFLQVTYDGVVDQSSKDNPICESGRFIYAEDLEEKMLLESVESIKCYIRQTNMNTKIINLNPYLSINWLYDKVESQVSSKVQLYIDGQYLVQNSDSLITHIYDDAIIHIVTIQDEIILKTIYFKQPQHDSTKYELFDISLKITVEKLREDVSKITGIALNNLYLVFSGRVLQKNNTLQEYGITESCVIYCVDGSKYLKKMTRQQYQEKVNERQRISENVKILREKKKKTSQQLEATSYKAQNQNQRPTYLENREQDFQYFAGKQQMQIQTQQMKAFQKIDDKQLINNKQSQQLETGNKESDGSLNRKFNAVPHNSLSNINYTDEAKINTDSHSNQTNIVKHDRKVIVSDDGTERIIETDITENAEGKIIQVDTDEITTKIDEDGNVHTTEKQIIESEHKTIQIITRHIQNKEGQIIGEQSDTITNQVNQLGDVHTHQKCIIQQKSGRTFQMEKDVVFNKNHEIISEQTGFTEVKQEQNGQYHRHQEKVVQKNGKVTTTEQDLLGDDDSHISHSENKTQQVQIDHEGHTHRHQVRIINDEHEKVTIQKDIIEDEDGQCIHSQYKETRIQQSSDGYVHKHTQQATTQGHDRVQVDKDQQYDNQGNLTRQEVDVKQITQTQQQIITREKKQTTQIQQCQDDEQDQRPHDHTSEVTEQNGKKITTQIDTYYNQEGEVIQRNTHKIQIEEDLGHHLHKYHEEHMHQQAGMTVTKTKQIQQDTETVKVKSTYIQGEGVQEQNQQIHCHERRTIEEDGRKITVEIDEQQAEDGEVIRRQTDQRQISVEEDGKVHTHISDIIQKPGLTTMQISDEIDSPGGTVLRKQRDEIQVTEDGQGRIHKHEIDTIEEGGTITLKEVDIQYDQNGVVTKKTTDDVTIDKDNSGQTYSNDRKVIEQGNQTHVTQSQIIEDRNGTVIRADVDEIDVKQNQDGTVQVHEREVIQGRDGKIIERVEDRIQNSNGQNIIIDTEQQDTKYDEDGNIHKHHRVIVQMSEGNQLIIDSDVIENAQGEVIRQQKSTIQITNNQNQQIVKQTIQSVQVEEQLPEQQQQSGYTREVQINESNIDGHIVRTQTEKLTNQKGEVIENRSDEIEINVDKQGHIHRHQVDLINEASDSHFIERDEQFDDDGVLVQEKLQDCEKKVDSEGNTQDRRTQMTIQNGKVVTHIEDTITDKNGNIVRTQQDDIKISNESDGLVHRKQKCVIRQGEDSVDRISNTIQNEQGQRLYQDLEEKDKQGNVHHHRTVHVQISGQHQIIVNRDTLQDSNGQLIRDEKDLVEAQINGQEIIVDQYKQVIQIEDQNGDKKDQRGQTHHCQDIQENIDGKLKKTHIQTIENQNGQIIQKERDQIQINQNEEGNILCHQTNVVQTQQGVLYVQKTDTYDLTGNLIKQTVEKIDERGDQEGNIYQQKLKQVTDNHGTHTTHIERTIQDSQGHITRKQNDDCEQIPQYKGGVNKRQVDRIQQNGKITILQTNSMEIETGVNIQNTNNLEITQEENGNVHTHYVETIITADKQIYEQEDLIEDEQGKVIQKQTKHTEILNTQGGIVQKTITVLTEIEGQTKMTQYDSKINELGQVIQDESNVIELTSSAKLSGEIDLVQASNQPRVICQQADMVEDKEGNIHVLSKQIKNEDGKIIIRQQQQVTDPEGHTIKQSSYEQINLIGIKKDDCGQNATKNKDLGDLLGLDQDDSFEQNKKSLQIGENHKNTGYGQFEQLEAGAKIAQSIDLLDDNYLQAFRNQQKQAVVQNLQGIYQQASKIQLGQEVSHQQKYSICVVAIDGQKWHVQINYDDNIDDIGEKFASISKSNKDSLLFCFGGNVLQPYEMAEEIGLFEDCYLYVQTNDNDDN